MDVEKQIDYWRRGSQKALRSVSALESGGFWEEALFWTHLAVEKALKAHVARAICDIPPYTHKLPRLAQLAGLDLTAAQVQLCQDLSIFQRLARYPDEPAEEVEGAVAERLLEQAKEFHQWLLKKL
jgi:HEPN domain-containing protein